MAYQHWFVSRQKRQLTTILSALIAFSDVCVGEKWAGNTELQLKFEDELQNRNITGHGTLRSRKSGQGGGGIRTLFKQLKDLGLVFTEDDNGRCQLTLIGEELVKGNITFVSAMRLQLQKYQYPSAAVWAGSGSVDHEFKVHPFQFMFRLLRDPRLNNSLSMEEMAGIVIHYAKSDNAACFEDVVNKILQYRFSGSVDGFVEDTKTKTYNNIANTFFNYISLTQYVDRGWKTLMIRSGKEADVDKFIQEKPKFIPNPELTENYQRAYGRGNSAKDLRNFDFVDLKSQKELNEARIRKEYVLLALKTPITGITPDIVDIIVAHTGIDEKTVENFLVKHYPHGNIYLYDKHGNLVYHLFRVYDLEADNEELYNHKVDSVLRSHLGEPEEHPLFEMENYYTSSDYSKDGEVFTLQKATKGKGIDLVFMGDAFVDKDMEPNGLYEQMMEAGMEKLFSIEPYKSLRDRFNVYSVKVVSPNNLILPGTTTAIQGNDQICFEYARKIPELNTTQMMICVIYSTPYFNSSTTMYQNDGSFVAYIRSGDISDVLIHEVGGHGIAKLMDEYVNAEYENQTLPESEKETMDYEWETFGWGANVDWRNDPATVRWSHFLQDDRYSNEGLGLYEGAYLYSFGAYRPTENSMMRYNDSPFNAPSREQIYKTVMQMSEGSSWTYDYEDFVEFDAVSRNAATTRSLRQAPSAAQVEKWKKSHRPPVRMKGTWRDARKESIAVPYR